MKVGRFLQFLPWPAQIKEGSKADYSLHNNWTYCIKFHYSPISDGRVWEVKEIEDIDMIYDEIKSNSHSQ